MSGWQVGVLLILAIPCAPFIVCGRLASNIRSRWRETYTRDKLKTTRMRLHRSPEAFTYRALCYYARAKPSSPQKTRRMLEKALAADPDYIPALCILGNALLEQGQHHEAIPYFARLISAWQHNPNVAHQFADYEQYARAAASPSPAAAQDPEPSSSASLPSAASQSLYMEGVPSGVSLRSQPGSLGFTAERPVYSSPFVFTFVIDEKDFAVSYPEVLSNLGMCHFNAGSYERALQLFQEAWDRGLHNWMLLFNMAQTLDKLGRSAQAAAAIADAVQLLRSLAESALFSELAMLLQWRLEFWERTGQHEWRPMDEQALALVLQMPQEALLATGEYDRGEQKGHELASLEFDQTVAAQIGLQNITYSWLY